jgi:hypothetical protein
MSMKMFEMRRRTAGKERKQKGLKNVKCFNDLGEKRRERRKRIRRMNKRREENNIPLACR